MVEVVVVAINMNCLIDSLLVAEMVIANITITIIAVTLVMDFKMKVDYNWVA